MKKCSTKLWKIMRLCATQLVVAIVTCGLSMAHDSYSQLLDRRITVDFQAVSLEQALYQIQEVGGVKMFFSLETIQVYETSKITFRVNDEPIRNILDRLLTPFDVKYKVDEKTGSVLILKRRGGKETPIPATGTMPRDVDEPLLVTGTITAVPGGEALAGVNVVLKGTTKGTTSDSRGEYKIAADENDVLVFSFIGYISVEVNIAARTLIDVTMQEDLKSLSEVIINAGYYETVKEKQTGNIGKVGSKEIAEQPVSNPIAALQGRIAGLEVTQQNGVPGGNFKVRIRGTNSIANGNDPLYVIDGVPYLSSPMSLSETSGNILGSSDPQASQGNSPLNSLNPSDIESIEVLKDADATAIYGSRGSNGVILITTKKGTAGPGKVDFNFYSGIADVPNNLNLLTTNQYLQMRKEGFANDNIPPSVTSAPDLILWDSTRYTNWQKDLIGRSASITDAQFSISGGENNTQFLIGSGYHRETTVFPGDNADQRMSVHASIVNRAINGKLKTSVSLNYSVNSTNLISEDLTGRALTTAPNAPAAFTENGELNWEHWNTIENPLAFLKRQYESNTNNMIVNGVFTYSILSSLQAKLNLGYSNVVNRAVTTIPVSSLNPASPDQENRSIFSNSYFQNWIIEPQLIWNPKINFGTLDVLAGATFMDQGREGLAQYANGFASESLMKNIGAAPTISGATNYYSEYRYQAFFGRLNYSFKDRYTVNATGRRDGSSRFGPGKQFANFGAIGMAWMFSKENFIHDAIPFLSYGKLRGSYGSTGNDQIGDYQYLDTYTSSGIYQGKLGLTPARLYNPEFAWETNRKLEAGIELGFANDQLLLGAVLYKNVSSNQLVALPLAPTTGFSSIQGNFPAVVQNTGFEFDLNTRNVENNNFSWQTSLNLSIPRNKLVEFPNLSSSPAYDEIYIVGEPLAIRKLYAFEGVNPVTGVYQFTDVNNDGLYDMTDRKSVRFLGQNLFGGIANNIRWKGLTMNVFFQFVKQKSFNYTHVFYLAPRTLSNQPSFVMGRWQSEGPSEIQKFATEGEATAAYSTLLYSSDYAVTDASFIRLKNLYLSYTFPGKWTSSIGVSKASIFAQCQNLLTFTNYQGLDPETAGNAVLPPLRTVTVGVHLTF